MAKQTPDQIAQKITAGEVNLASLVEVKDTMGQIDGRTLDPTTRGAFKEAKANITQTLSSQRAAIKALKAEQKAALKA